MASAHSLSISVSGKFDLLTNNPKKIVGLDGYDLHIVERVPIQMPANRNNRRYLQTKKDKLGHLLDEVDIEETD